MLAITFEQPIFHGFCLLGIMSKESILKKVFQTGKSWNRAITPVIAKSLEVTLSVLVLGSMAFGLFQYDQAKQSYAERQEWLRFSLAQLRETLLDRGDREKQALLIQAFVLTTLAEVQGPERGALIAFLSQLELLTQLSLAKAQLQQADLSELNLQGSDLQQANFSGANLSLALLNQSDLSQTTLIEADLTGAELQNAILSFANAQKANLSGAY
ncbi:MAG: pentapeptide repeat-containing protein, partial [Thermostichus sp. BF3_bins_97]